MDKYEMLNKQQKQNLEHLRDFIKKVPPETFEMGTYCGVKNRYGHLEKQFNYETFSEARNEVLHTCGSCMCLLGWSASVPELAKQLPIEGNTVCLGWSDVGDTLFGTDDSCTEIGRYLFSAEWAERERTNTIEHALYRINRVLSAETEEDYEDILAELERSL